MGDTTAVLDADLLGIGLSIRHIGVIALTLACIISVGTNIICGRPGRPLCGAPIRGSWGRCHRPLASHGQGCGIHSASWPLTNSLLMIIVAVAASALLLNFERITPWVVARITGT